METWNEGKIKDFADVKGGKRLPKGKKLITEPNSHPYIRIRDLGKGKVLELNSDYEYVDDETQESIAKYIVEAGDILVSVVGTIGLIAIVGESLDRANQTENCDKIINIKGIDRDYLYYYLISPAGQEEIRRGTVGAVQPKLPLKNVQDITVKYPSIGTQQKIVSILNSIDDKIAANEQINRNLSEQAMVLYKEIIFDASEECSEGVLSDIADIVMGQSPKGDTYNEDGVGAVFYQGRAEFGERFPTRRLFTTAPKRMAKENSVLMSVRAPVGDVNVAYEECCIGRGLCSVASKDNHQSFVLYTMYRLKDKFDVYNGEGTVFGSINKDSMNCMTIQIPNKMVMDRFEEIVSPMDAIIKANYNENCRLVAMRDSLIPKLMSGQLDVSNLDI